MTTINLHCKCLTIDKKCYNRRNEISNIVYTNPLTICGSEGIFWCGYSWSPFGVKMLKI